MYRHSIFHFRITQNQTSIAVVERNSQSVHIFDKQTKEQIDEVQNLLRTDGTFRLWNVLVNIIPIQSDFILFLFHLVT